MSFTLFLGMTRLIFRLVCRRVCNAAHAAVVGLHVHIAKEQIYHTAVFTYNCSLKVVNPLRLLEASNSTKQKAKNEEKSEEMKINLCSISMFFFLLVSLITARPPLNVS